VAEFRISDQVVTVIANYLAERPYKEVFQIIQLLRTMTPIDDDAEVVVDTTDKPHSAMNGTMPLHEVKTASVTTGNSSEVNNNKKT
jgi:hypothetical protein